MIKENINLKKAQLKQLSAILLVMALFSLIVLAEPLVLSSYLGIVNSPDNSTNKFERNNTVLNNTERLLAILNNLGLSQQVNNLNVIGDNYSLIYFEHNNNFSNVSFESIKVNNNLLLKSGNIEKEINAFEINNKRYIIDLLVCDKQNKYCWFRVNGIVIKRISYDVAYGKNEIILDDVYKIRVNDIKFDYCENKAVCDYYYDAYDFVNISIKR